MSKLLRVLVFFISIFIISGCSEQTDSIIDFKDDHGLSFNYVSDITYKFTGVSDHFCFETGKVYYGENNQRYILIKNFKLIKELKNKEDIVKYSYNLYFNNKAMFGNEMVDLDKTDLENKISEIVIEEQGEHNESDYGESDAFLDTVKEDFKNSVKFEIKYCYKNSKCETEVFKINYFY